MTSSIMLLYILSFAYLIALTGSVDSEYEKVDVEDKDYWRSMASANLDETLHRRENAGVAKNVIVFIGDGMGMSTITAGRIYKGGENHILSFEKFPATGLSKTYNVDNRVSDSASTATAIFTGVKTKQNMLGLDSSAIYDHCDLTLNQHAKVASFMSWAQKAGMDTGIVTTTRITHATPGATYSHINNRDWECDGNIPANQRKCVKDIARQLVEDEPGKNFKVILGGGRNEMGDTNGTGKASCKREDGKNLTQEWKKAKKNSKYVTTADELSHVDIKSTDYLLGLFSPDHLNYTAEKVATRPRLKLMTATAIKMLQKNKRGFALMVEGGRIDHGHHDNRARLALSELDDLDEAVAEAVRLTNEKDTLIIVTADHSHVMTLNGYPPRGSDILGLASDTSNEFYQTLTYANGPGFSYHHLKEKQDNCHGNCDELQMESVNSWRDIRKEKDDMKKNIYYRNLAAVYRDQETHGGEDVPIYASGPMSHLLVGVHEENYIASVISYATCTGPESHRCTKKRSLVYSSASTVTLNRLLTIVTIVFALFKFAV